MKSEINLKDYKDNFYLPELHKTPMEINFDYKIMDETLDVMCFLSFSNS